MTIEDTLKKGEELFLAGRASEAESLFNKVLEAEPGQIRALNNLAILAMRDGRFQDAEKSLNLALKENSNNTRTLQSIIDLYCCQQKWPQAAEAAALVIRQVPNDKKALLTSLKAEMALENYEQAELNAAKLLEHYPDNEDGLECLAFIHVKTGATDKAIKELERLLALKPQRADLASRLARLKNPEALSERELWPKPVKLHPLELSKKYNKFWGQIKTSDPVRHAAGLLGNLVIPDSELERLNPFEAQQNGPKVKTSKAVSDIAGLSIMFGPTIIAGQSAIMARWLRKQKADTINVEISRSYLGYQADLYYPENESQRDDFIRQTMKKAEKCQVLCLDFGSSFSYMPNFVSLADFRQVKVPGQPYADLLPLKDKGVKIFFQYWGSDSVNQSLGPYLYLTYLGFEDVPPPPSQTKRQHENVMAANEVADAMIGPSFFHGLVNLPRLTPSFDVCIEPELWPMKTAFNGTVRKILTAPTNPLKKNYSLLKGALEGLESRHPHISSFLVKNVAHDKVAERYCEADLGMDQAVYTFGAFTVEMMALGIPAVAGKLPRFHHNTRKLAPVISFRNTRELAGKLEECVQNPGLLKELSQMGRDYALEYHSADTVGRTFSHYLAEAVSGGAVTHDACPLYEPLSRIWNMDPEKVHCFRFYDVAVPLFCALGEFTYALNLCIDALNCDYRREKFTAWYQAIEVVCGPTGIKLSTPETESLVVTRGEYINMIKDGKALLEEYDAMRKEAAGLNEGRMPFWERDCEGPL